VNTAIYFDTHCHIHDARFTGERAAIIESARKAQVKYMVCVGCHLGDIENAQALAQVHHDIYFSAGIHPHDAETAPDNFLTALEGFAKHPRCVAIGECGLDFYYSHSAHDVQKTVFSAQIELAKNMNKALIIHVRDAWELCVDMLTEHKKQLGELPRTVIHCFTGSVTQAERFLALGCFISLSGIITFKDPGELIEVAKAIPLDRLLIETDAPYLAPMPHRGKRNEPAFIVETARAIATHRGIDISELAAQTTRNARTVFAI
jgi:TatD DNase family protein